MHSFSLVPPWVQACRAGPHPVGEVGAPVDRRAIACPKLQLRAHSGPLGYTWWQAPTPRRRKLVPPQNNSASGRVVIPGQQRRPFKVRYPHFRVSRKCIVGTGSVAPTDVSWTMAVQVRDCSRKGTSLPPPNWPGQRMKAWLGGKRQGAKFTR